MHESPLGWLLKDPGLIGHKWGQPMHKSEQRASLKATHQSTSVAVNRWVRLPHSEIPTRRVHILCRISVTGGSGATRRTARGDDSIGVRLWERAQTNQPKSPSAVSGHNRSLFKP